MESLAFVAAVALLLVVLHAVVAAYVYRVAHSGDGRLLEREASPDERAVQPTDEPEPPEVPDDSVSCPTCGAPNDPCYQFCRRCVADLSGKQRASAEVAAGRLGS